MRGAGPPGDLGVFQSTPLVIAFHLTFSGTTYYCAMRCGERGWSLINYGTVASTALQAAVDFGISVQGTTIRVRGDWPLTSELTFTGWEAVNPLQQLIFEGEGWTTRIWQNTAGLNAIVVRNRINLVIRDMCIECGSVARSAIRGDNTGANETSFMRGGLHNLLLTTGNASYPALYLINFSGMSCGWIRAENPNYHAIIFENNSASANYGNSSFERIQTYAGVTHSGLVVQAGAGQTNTLNVITIKHFECSRALRGLDFENSARIQIGYAVLEGIQANGIGIECSGPSATEGARYITVKGGYVSVPSGGTGISCGLHSEACHFEELHLVGAAGATWAVSDTQGVGRIPNRFDIILGGIFTTAHLNVISGRTLYTYRISTPEWGESNALTFYRWLEAEPYNFRGAASRTFGANNRVVLRCFSVRVTVTVDGGMYCVGDVAAGNVRACIYGPVTPTAGAPPDLPDGSALVVESAAVAQGAIGNYQFISLTPTRLLPGLYWLAIAGSDATGTFYGALGDPAARRFDYAGGAFPATCPATLDGWVCGSAVRARSVP